LSNGGKYIYYVKGEDSSDESLTFYVRKGKKENKLASASE